IRDMVRARRQDLHVEAMAAPIAVLGDEETLAGVLARVLGTASDAAGEGGIVTLAVTQIGLNATLKIHARSAGEAATAHSQQHESCDWSNVERLLEPHGGVVSRCSYAEGMEYRLLLPVMPEEPVSATRRAPLIAGPEAPTCRVLVVDDSPDAADSMACLLSIRGHEVRVAYDGISAYEKV